MKVTQVSESEFSVQGHGVHTAFVETCQALDKYSDVELAKNSFQKADIRHIHTIGPYALLQVLFGSGKKVVSAHVVPDSFVGSLAGAKYWLWLAKLYLRWFYNRSALVLAVSEQTRQELLQIGVRSPIKVLHNMVDTSKYRDIRKQRLALRRKYNIATDEKVVIGNGQIQPRKRVDCFISMARSLPDVRFIWIGGMPFGKASAHQSAMNKIIKTAPRNVTITGVVPHRQVAEYFGLSDVFVMTSEQETFGLAIVEAAAAGLPIVLRDIEDYKETFSSYSLMCQDDKFSPNVEHLLDDEKLYKKYQNQAKQLSKRYSSDLAVIDLLAIYETVLAS